MIAEHFLVSASKRAVRWWTSESSALALRAKQMTAAVLPESLLIAIKKRYYTMLLRTSRLDSVEGDTDALPHIVKRGDFVIDIGAFVGFYTKSLSSLVGPCGKVWSIEPVPQTFQILSYTTHKLRLKNVELFNCAISDSEGLVTMEVPRYRGGGETWYDARIVRGRKSTQHTVFNASARTLDSLTGGVNRSVTFIKCDAEFHELFCVRGALKTIRRWKPALLIEMLESPDHGADQRKLVELLPDLGYMPYWFDGSPFHLRQSGQNSQNYFFFSNDHRTILENSHRLAAYSG